MKRAECEQRQVIDHWFGILAMRAAATKNEAMRAAATKNEKIQEGAIKRYVGWGRVPTETVGACAKG
jgi:hypothetical protein